MQKRLYSLFEKQDGKWVRICDQAFHKEAAVRIFQNALLAPLLGNCEFKGIRELKVVSK